MTRKGPEPIDNFEFWVRHMVAYHEAGHAVVGWCLGADPEWVLIESKSDAARLSLSRAHDACRTKALSNGESYPYHFGFCEFGFERKYSSHA
jgi:hypothetical protein